MTQHERQDETINPFASPVPVISHVEIDTAESALLADLRAFVGPNADYYLKKWAPRLNDPSQSAGANFAAFFLSLFWLPYRKMYKLAAIFYGIIIVELIIETLIYAPQEPPEAPGRFLGLLISIACSAYGNRWYLAHAQKAIAKTRAEGLEGGALRERLSKLGGTNIWASLGMLAAFVVVLLVVFSLVEGFLMGMTG
jgi:hypothetical protein